MLVIVSFGLSFVSCKKDFYSDSVNDKLTFSSDSVLFDTIFTEKGSITQYIRIKNNCDGTVKINKIYLNKSTKSEFFINVNGQPGPCVENIDIDAGDSIFVFFQIKLQAQDVDTILFHEDYLNIDYNGRTDKIVLAVWGQDAVNFRGNVVGTTTFTANKPYLIYDSLVVAEGETLTIEAGAKVYFHYNANLIVKGTLKIQGTKDQPVTLWADRLEETYQLLPGQWGSIIFDSTSTNNSISYAKIKNGVNGLVCYGKVENQLVCNIDNTEISNMSGYGIYAINAHIDSYNCIFANCEYNVLNLQGGWFNSIHNTIYNEGTPNGRKYQPTVSISDYQTDTKSILVEQANFFNSIIVGTMSNEIQLTATNGDNTLKCKFKNCLLRDSFTVADSSYYESNTYYDKNKTLFSDVDSYALDSLSQAINIGNMEYANMHPNDLNNHSRVADEKPDVGALEYFYEEKKDKN